MSSPARAEIQRLLERLADGDRSAVEPAFAVLWPLLRRFSARALGQTADAEDAAQRTLLKIFSQVARFDTSKNGLAWLLTIASYECRSALRKRGRRREPPLDDERDPPHALDRSPEALVIEQDLLNAARDVLSLLPAEDASTILSALDDDRPTGATFRKRLQRALAKLRFAWRTKHEVE